jgi:SpoU rRNA methylase family enzyme
VSVWLRLILPAVFGVAALAGVAAYITSAERAKSERDSAERRIENIKTSQEIKDAVESLDPDAHWLELCERLSACH